MEIGELTLIANNGTQLDKGMRLIYALGYKCYALITFDEKKDKVYYKIMVSGPIRKHDEIAYQYRLVIR